MKTVKVKNCPIVVPKGSAFTIETKPEHIKLCTNCIATGKRGSGKSVAITSLMRMLPFDRIFIISPTVQSNKALLDDLNIDDEDVYSDPDDESNILDIINKVEQEVQDYENYHHQLAMYKKFKKLLTNPLVQIPDEMLLAFYGDDGNFSEPTHRWNGRKPVLALFVDDCQATKMFRSKRFQNMITRHRHIGMFSEGGALGLSVFIAIQNYKASGQPCLRAIRNNATHLIVFKTKDEKEFQDIYSEVAGEIDFDTFKSVYDQATAGDHNFLFIDLHKKPHHPSMFRQNFDKFIIPPTTKSDKE